jgi:NitT/TauT family transport system substrate-binding protein
MRSIRFLSFLAVSGLLLAACGGAASPAPSSAAPAPASAAAKPSAASSASAKPAASGAAAVSVSAKPAGSASAAAGGQVGPPEKAKLTMAIGGASQFIYWPATLAKQLNYYKDEGLDVDIQDFSGGAKAEEAMLGGSADVVTGFYDHSISLQPQGKFIQTFTLFDNYPALVLLVDKQKAGSIKSFADLKGKKVGVTAPGSSTHYMVNYLASQSNISPNDFSIVGVGTGQTAIAAIKNHQVDAEVTVDPAATQLVQTGDAVIMYDTRTQKGTQEVFGGTYPAGGYYAQTDWIKKYPNTVQHLANAGVKTLAYIQTHKPDEIAAKMPQEFLGGDKNLTLQALTDSMSLFSKDGLVPQDGPATVQKVLANFDPKVKAANINLQDTYSNVYAQRAAALVK